MTPKHPDDKLIPALEVNEVGDELPGGLPFAGECAHPHCKKTPIVGVSKRFVCEDHLKWVLDPIREIVKLVQNNTHV